MGGTEPSRASLAELLVDHQHALRGKYDATVEFGATPGGTWKKDIDMFCVPIVVTISGSARGQELLSEDDWLGLAENRVLFTITGTVWEAPGKRAPQGAPALSG